MTMVDDLGFFSKETLLIKPPKRSTALRQIFIIFALVCGFSICSVCLKQSSIHIRTELTNTRVSDRSCHNYDHGGSEIRYIHYPKPLTFSRADCAHNPVRFFAILTMQRSGSGWFETLLNSHVNVSSNGEIFNDNDRRNNISMIVKTLDKVYNLDWLSSASKNLCSAAVGFKWMFNQGLLDYHEDIVKYFNSRGVSTILLFRKNFLRRMVSELANSHDHRAKLLNGTHKSHVHSPEEADMLSKYKPMINSTSLIADLSQAELTAAKALRYFRRTRHIVIYYEDLLKNKRVLAKVQSFLGLPRMDLTSRQVKIHKGRLSEHIENWEEVNRTLHATAYERFLHADY